MRRALALACSLPLAAAAAFALASPADEASPERGREVFMTYCMTCHGPTGEGDGPASKSMEPPPRSFVRAEFRFGGTDQDLFDIISNGAASKGGDALMAPWAEIISEADRWALVRFIRTLKR